MGESAEAYVAYGVHITGDDVYGQDIEEVAGGILEETDLGIGHIWGWTYDEEATGFVVFIPGTRTWAMDAVPTALPDLVVPMGELLDDLLSIAERFGKTPSWLVWGQYW